MATVFVPVMRAKVDPNPRGSATAHVTMPSANPFEREIITVRNANQPREMMPGMGDFSFGSGDMVDSSGKVSDTAKATGTGFDWSGLLKDVTGAAINVGQQAAIQELSKPKDQPASAAGAQGLLATAAQALAARRAAALQTPSTQTLPVAYPAPSSGMSKSLPWIIGAGVLLLGGGALLLTRKGGKTRRTYRRRRR